MLVHVTLGGVVGVVVVAKGQARLASSCLPLANQGKRTSAVEDHAAGAGQVMLLQALLVDGLLGDDVAGAEEDGRGDDLCQQGPLGQLGLVPEGEGVSVSI